MTYLFFFAHPDDESVGCAATIRQLVDHGDRVILVTATDGSGGKVHPNAETALREFGNLGALRRHELKQVTDLLGVHETHILDFEDGQISNKMVWTEITNTFVEYIDKYKPDVVVTFDHTGWYFHLDHVGVSIAATLAFQQASHRPEALLLSHFRVNAGKWKYVFSDTLPVTHVVLAANHQELKLRALNLHASQSLSHPKTQLKTDDNHHELYQLAFASEKGKEIFRHNPIFKLAEHLKGKV